MITVKDYEESSRVEQRRIWKKILKSDEFKKRIASFKTPEDYKIEWERLIKRAEDCPELIKKFGDRKNWPIEQVIYENQICIGYIVYYVTPRRCNKKEDLEKLPEDLQKHVRNGIRWMVQQN